LTHRLFYGTTNVKKFREGRNKEFRSKEESPLTEKDFPNFKGLNYFSVNEKYRLTAEFVRTSDAKYFKCRLLREKDQNTSSSAFEIQIEQSGLFC
jgi:uncharacterized protein (DUF1684 family)